MVENSSNVFISGNNSPAAIQFIETSKTIFKTTNNNIGKQNQRDGAYLFISFDLSNSTAFKDKYPMFWRHAIKSFYNAVADIFYSNSIVYDSEVEDICLWKFNGDEVLLYKKLGSNDAKQLYNDIKNISMMKSKIINVLCEKASDLFNNHSKDIGCQNNNCVFNEYYEGPYEEFKKKVKEYLKVKTTIWIASCGENNKKYDNLVYDTNENENEYSNNMIIDFLGPDIDEGFRLSKYSEPDIVLVSPKLCLTLVRLSNNDTDLNTLLNNNFLIVNYQSLKGVWNERPYPIIIFSQCFDMLQKNLSYDSFINSGIGKSLKDIGETRKIDHHFKISHLKKIYEDLHKDETVDKLIKIIKEIGEQNKVKAKHPYELHLACLCYCGEKVLIFNHKNRGWDFGCVHVGKIGSSLDQEVKNGYYDNFNINLDIDKNPIPIATYGYTNPSSKRSALGFILTSRLSNDFNINEIDTSAKYKESYKDKKLVSKEEIETMQMNGELAVDDFYENILYFFSIKYKIKNKKKEESK